MDGTWHNEPIDTFGTETPDWPRQATGHGLRRHAALHHDCQPKLDIGLDTCHGVLWTPALS